MQQITPAQITKIHVLVHLLGWSDDDYRAALGGYHVKTCKDMNILGAADLIDKMEKLSMPARPEKPVDNRRKYEDTAIRDSDMATPAQLRMLDAMWRQVTRCTAQQDIDAAFRSFVRRQTCIDDPRWLEKRHIGGLKKTLEIMIKQSTKELQNV